MHGLVVLIGLRRGLLDEIFAMEASGETPEVGGLKDELVGVEDLLKRELYECLGMLCGLTDLPSPKALSDAPCDAIIP